MNEDSELLRRFTAENSEPAFRELVARRINFVYATALRQVGGDVHLAQEVAQSVFIDVARKARMLAQRTSISGWLYTSVRFAAAKARRSRSRRINYEQEAHAMHELLSEDSARETDWNELRPVLDAAMHELGEVDREAILLRYFEGRALTEVGASLGIAENTARMRVERALEKLRGRLARRGITSTAVALGAALAAQPAAAAPAGLAARLSAGALAGAAVAAGGGAWAVWAGAFEFMKTGKLLGVVALALAAAGVGGFFAGRNNATRPTGEETSAVSRLRQELATLRSENRRLAAERTSLLAQNTKITPAVAARPTDDMRTRLRTLTDLQKRGLVKPYFNVIFSTGKIAPAFVELFQLNPAEQEALQKAVGDARSRIEQLALANAAVRRIGENQVVIDVQPTAEGSAVADSLLDEFGRVLGPERAEAFKALGIKQVEQAFNQFGAEIRTISLTRTIAGDGTKTYDLEDRHKTAENGSRSEYSKGEKLADLTGKFGGIGKLIPEDF